MGMRGDRSLTVMSDHSSLGADTMKLEIKKEPVCPTYSIISASLAIIAFCSSDVLIGSSERSMRTKGKSKRIVGQIESCRGNVVESHRFTYFITSLNCYIHMNSILPYQLHTLVLTESRASSIKPH